MNTSLEIDCLADPPEGGPQRGASPMDRIGRKSSICDSYDARFADLLANPGRPNASRRPDRHMVSFN